MRLVLAIVSLVCLAAPSVAQDRAEVERQFQNWLQQAIWPQAKAKGRAKPQEAPHQLTRRSGELFVFSCGGIALSLPGNQHKAVGKGYALQFKHFAVNYI